MVRVLRLASSVRLSRRARRGTRAWRVGMWSALYHFRPQGVNPTHGQRSLFALLHFRSIPSPTTLCRPDSLSEVFVIRLTVTVIHTNWMHGLPSRAERLGFRHLAAGSPRQQAESSSRTLRTGPSSPVALHLPSQERSYLRLREIRHSPTRTLTSLIQQHYRRTATGSSLPVRN
jgi:hypothetical protein